MPWKIVYFHNFVLFRMKALVSLRRAQASCPCTCSWSATRQRRSTSLATRASTGLASATAPTTRASSSTRRSGRVGEVPPTSRAKRLSRWAPATLLSSNAPTTIKSPLRPAEGGGQRSPEGHPKGNWRATGSNGDTQGPCEFSFKEKLQLKLFACEFAVLQEGNVCGCDKMPPVAVS